ncbi:MAG TPA: lipoyl(octanoyl) transferase LipB [Actinomycetota bacterium]|nr:lipoyl(octanoyl) transferase LipB [Actinomycetota bacterium]
MRSARLIRPAGAIPYAEANTFMHELAEARLRGEGQDTLILLEHPPVYTAGRTSKDDHVVWTEDRMRAAGAELHFIDRGGSLTFHGPGQLVGYPIVDLGSRPEALAHVRRLEEVVIRSAADVGIALHRSDVQTGVWSGERKVCAIGVRLMRMRVSLHGFALNCTNDLSWFDAIVPCGLGHTGVTSLSELARRDVTVDEMTPIVARRFEEVFDLRFEREERAWPRTIPAPAAS